MGRMDGKVAVITGAARGIGAAAARRFVAEGARVMLVDRLETQLTALVDELGADNAAFRVADVTDEAETKGYVDAALARFGQIDAVLLNAGVEGAVARIPDYPTETFDQVMAVNVRAVWLGLKYAMPAMAAKGGSIVLTSSTAGIRAVPKLSAYIASKHAVIGLMRNAALEGAADNIRVNTVNPSPIDTDMMTAIEQKSGVASDRSNRPMAQGTPLKRYGEPEEVAALMLFLASDESSFCTGGVYMVDGGVSAGRA